MEQQSEPPPTRSSSSRGTDRRSPRAVQSKQAYVAEPDPKSAPPKFAYLSLSQSQRAIWTIGLSIGFVLVTLFAWTRTAPTGSDLPAPFTLARFFRPIEVDREFRSGYAPIFYSVSAIDAQRAWAVGWGLPIKTTDGGRSWQSVSSPIGNLHSVYFVDAQRGWAVGDDGGIIATTDAGASWYVQPTPTKERLFSVRFLDAQRGWAAGSNGTILTTNDGGASWDSKYKGTLDFLSVQFVDAQHGWIVANDGEIFVTTNGGVDWHVTPPLNPEAYSVHFVNSQNGWAVGPKGTIISSINGGTSWRASSSGTPLALLSLDFADSQRGWIVGEAGTILATNDGGANWYSRPSSTQRDLFSIRFVNPQRGWAVGDGIILSTDNGGASWYSNPLPVYWSLCPPWYFWVSPLFLVGLVVLNRPRIIIRRGILGAPIRDSAAETLEEDFLGAHRLVDTLVGFVTNRATVPPLCITVEGPWGTGKSSVLQMIRSQLKKKRAAQTVWFNAWHHQKEDPLLAYLLEAIKREAVPPLLSVSGLLFRLDLLVIRLKDKPLQFAVAGAALIAAVLFWADVPIPQLTNILKWVKLPDSFHGPVTTLAAFGYFYQTFFRAFGADPEKLVTSSRALLNFGDLRGKTDVRADFQRELKDVVGALEAQDRRLVIFLDDLDRCRPHQVVVVMEAVNFLSSAADCFIFLGTDREKVLTAVGLYYKNLAVEEVEGKSEKQVRRDLAESYLRKMINIRTRVPQPTALERGEYLKHQVATERSPWTQLALRVAIVALALCVGSAWWLQKHNEVDLTGKSQAPATPAVATARPPRPAPDVKQPPAGPGDGKKPPLAPQLPLPLQANAYARWLWTFPVAIAALAGVVFLLRVRQRPDIEDMQDRPEFTEALAAAERGIWTKAAGNPRGAKRIQNMLRFLAASDRTRESPARDPNFEPNLVGFATFGSLDHFPRNWKWPPTPQEAKLYKELCSHAGLNWETLEPADEAKETPSA